MDFISYKKFLKKHYPSAYEFVQETNWKPIFFSESLTLSSKNVKEMEKVIKSLFKLKHKESYQKNLSIPSPDFMLKQQKQDAVLMAYDFHIEKGQARLIEVNTNASAFLLVNSLYQFLNLPYQQALQDLKNSFTKEWKKFHQNKNEKAPLNPKKIVLIDKDPIHQKMAIEFFMYKDFFQSMAWDLEICDSFSLKLDDQKKLCTNSGEKIDFIYNRSTDFYFEKHPHLAQAYKEGTCAISPHPREYYLLSDKNRLCDWSLQKDQFLELQDIQDHLSFSEILNNENKDRIWQDRKQYFFKHRTSYGGKSAYRGASLTRKKFNLLCEEGESLIQKFISPSITTDKDGGEWKTDFRVYAYEDRIQQLTARCYKGQLTNFREEGSGLASIIIV